MDEKQSYLYKKEACELIRKTPCLQHFFQEFFTQSEVMLMAPTEPERITRYEGQRDVALLLKSILDEHDPLLFYDLIRAQIAEDLLTENSDGEADDVETDE